MTNADGSNFVSALDDFCFDLAETTLPSSNDNGDQCISTFETLWDAGFMASQTPENGPLTSHGSSQMVRQRPSSECPKLIPSVMEVPLLPGGNSISDYFDTTPPRNISDGTTILVDFYFRHIAPLFCCSRDIPNPFDSGVKHCWTESSGNSVAYAIQSMSLACLARCMPGLHRAAWHLREQSLAATEKKTNTNNHSYDMNTAFTLILMGTSAGWFQPRDSNHSMASLFARYVSLVSCTDVEVPGLSNSQMVSQEGLFLKGILTYWGMFLGFMSSAKQGQSSQSCLVDQPPPNGLVVELDQLHPWTGISQDVCELLRRTGLLIRANRERILRPFGKSGLAEQRADFKIALDLEKRFTSMVFPGVSTCEWQQRLYRLAEAYRLTGLLQLYRSFPEFLSANETPGRHGEHDSEPAIHFVPVEIASQILKSLLNLPSDLHTLRFQLIPLVAASTELGPNPKQARATGNVDEQLDLRDKIRISRARTLVMYQLESMQRVFPGDRMHQVTRLVREVWKRLDYENTGKRPFWIDVAIENDWDTI